MYVLVENENVIKYPYSFSQLREDNPNVSYTRNPTDETLEYFNIFRVNEVPQPEIDEIKQNIVEGIPEFKSGQWYQTWDVYSASEKEIEVRIDILKKKINLERDRRIDLPKFVSLSSGKSFNVNMSDGGRQSISNLETTAISKSMIQDNSTFSFRDADNVDWELSNSDILEMGIQITKSINDIHIKARELKDMENIPSDYTNDIYWRMI
jgi:hypothetical protein